MAGEEAHPLDLHHNRCGDHNHVSPALPFSETSLGNIAQALPTYVTNLPTSQVAGAALIGVAASNRKDPTTANNILLTGLAIQSAAFLIYLILLGVVISAIFRNPVLKEKMRQRRSPFIFILAVASILVFLRTLFRLIETSEGIYGNLSTHEAYFGGLEFAPMVVAIWLLAIWHPGRWMTNSKREERKSISG